MVCLIVWDACENALRYCVKKVWLALEPHSELSCVVSFELCDVREKRNRNIVGSSA